MPGVGSIILPLGLILARPQRLGVEEQRRAATRQVAAAPGEVAPRVARPGVEAALAGASTVAGRAGGGGMGGGSHGGGGSASGGGHR